MFPKKLVEFVSLKWFILELNKLQTSPPSTGICENEQVWPADFPTTQGVAAFGEWDVCYCKPQYHFYSEHPQACLGSPLLGLGETSGSLFLILSHGVPAGAQSSGLCTRSIPLFKSFALVSCALAGIKEAAGTNGFPCILNSLLH